MEKSTRVALTLLTLVLTFAFIPWRASATNRCTQSLDGEAPTPEDRLMADRITRIESLPWAEYVLTRNYFMRNGAQVLAELRAAVDSPNPQISSDFLLALEKVAPTEAYELSLNKIRSGHDNLNTAMWVIYRHIQRHDDAALQAVHNSLRHGSQEFYVAIKIFAKVRDASSLDWLSTLITSRDWTARHAVTTYSLIDPRAGAELFRTIAQDRSADLELRMAAIRALGRNADRADIPLLQTLKDELPLTATTHDVLFCDFGLALSHPLYRQVAQVSAVSPFAKPGSELYLLPGFTDRVVRVIPAGALEQWKKVSEAGEVWRSHGFDYIPVEEIVATGPELVSALGQAVASAIPVKANDVAVLAKVLPGLTLRSLQTPSNDVLEWPIILEKKRAILQVLRSLDVFHGHPHDGNFVLVGERLYLIDFDIARPLTDEDPDETRPTS